MMKALACGTLAALALAGCQSTQVATHQLEPRPIRTYPDRVIPGGPIAAQSASLAANTLNAPTAPTLAQPLTSGIGSPAVTESARASGTISQGFAIPRADETLRNAPISAQADVFNSAVTDLPARVRQALTTGRPESITRLAPERLERFEIDAVNGTVTLRGNVRSETERLMIGHRVAGMEGVRAVNNQLRVVSPTRQGMEDPSAPASRGNALESEN